MVIKFQFDELNRRWMLVWSWCKCGATLYRAILTIFTISNGTLKTPRDNFDFWSNTKNAQLRLGIFYYLFELRNKLWLTYRASYDVLRTVWSTKGNQFITWGKIITFAKRTSNFKLNFCIPFTFQKNYDIIKILLYLIKKLEFCGGCRCEQKEL